MAKTFFIQTLGCKVNQYESDQIAQVLRSRGLVQVDSPAADVRVINTCSVTVQAASKSRQIIRRATRLPVLTPGSSACGLASINPAAKTIVTGCWATSDRDKACGMPGVDAVLTHHEDVARDLGAILDRWNLTNNYANTRSKPPSGLTRNDGWMTSAGTSAGELRAGDDTLSGAGPVKRKPAIGIIGTHALPILHDHQTGRQRAYLKVQDGCDAHCTYCIIPRLRPTLWSKSVEDAAEEASALVAAGHKEIVLTGIFLGAYGRETALRRRQQAQSGHPITTLVEALCTRVPGLRRLRFSSLEPGDLTDDLIAVLRSHEQVVPHFHLPLQSGSDELLRRMNRQYSRRDYLRMIESAHRTFDRPAITTDIIVGFPGETDSEFERTLEIVDRAKFIHIHAFSFSPRPGTAAARWTRDFVRGPVVNERIEILNARAQRYDLEFREQFFGERVEVLVERPQSESSLRHGRCERYFGVHFEDSSAQAGDLVELQIDHVTPHRTIGTRLA